MLESTQIRSVNFPNCPPFVSRKRMDQPVKFAKVAFMDHAGGPTSVVRVAHKPSHNYSCTVFGAAMEFRNEVQLGRLIVHILPGFSVERKHVGAGGDLYGLCAGAKHSANLRQTYAETVSSELNSYQDQFLSWDIIADLPKRVALKVVGPVPKRDHRPWFRGTEKELASLESDAHKAELKWRTAKRRNEESAELALRERRLASSKFRAAKRRWEACWWGDLASKAQEAGGSGDSAAFWQICRQLGFRESLRRQTRERERSLESFFTQAGKVW